MRLQPHDWVPPATVREYRLLRPLGSGGMGLVFLGHDPDLDRLVAVKFIAAVEPDERRRDRFIKEGRAVARINHPNVVTVYHAGEVEGRPYLVSEYVRGKPLDSIEKPLEPLRVAQIGQRLARGLAAAHKGGVLHRDLKPANAILTDDGEVKLLDFGLAKFTADLSSTASESGPEAGADDPDPAITRAGAVLGTPAYMAPETLRGDPASRQSDVFSLGTVLFELATGTPARPPREPDQTHAAVAALPLPKLAERARAVDARLARVIDRCLEADPAARFSSADELADALEELLPQRQHRAVPHGNPYRGLHPFEAEHRALFFGRDADVNGVLERLRAEAIVLVAGDSGVGKSSLCRAGVLPRVAEGGLGAERAWSVVTLVPGRKPVAALCAALAQSLDTAEEALGAWVRSEPAALARALRGRFQKTGVATLLFFDQLEELLTLSDPAEAALLAEALGHLSVPTPGTRVLAAVRGDFFTRLAALPGLGPEVSRALYLLRPLTAEQIRATVVGPAKCKGVSFESDAFVGRLVETTAAAAGGLPLLQFALAELWEARDASAGVIREESLARIGGVEGALARHADSVLTAMLPEQRAATRGLLVRLVTPEGTRSHRTSAELGATDGAARAALEALVHGRLVVAREAEGATSYEVAHEALIRGWGTYAEWLDTDAERRGALTRIDQAAAEWVRLGRSPDALWHRRQLADARNVVALDLTPRQREFIAASERRVRRDRGLRWAAFALGPLTIAVAAGIAQARATSEMDARVQRQLDAARGLLAPATRALQAGERDAEEAFSLYDQAALHTGEAAQSWALAERRWRAAHRMLLGGEAQAQDGIRMLDAGLLLGARQDEVRAALAEALETGTRIARRLYRHREASALDARRTALLGETSARVQTQLTLVTRPPANHSISRYRDVDGRLQLEPAGAIGHGPVAASLDPGSYRVTWSAAGMPTVHQSIVLDQGSRSREVILELPHAGDIPGGFAFVPAGQVLFGSQDAEELRIAFETAPLHRVNVPAFLISRFEVTFAEWLRFLDALPEGEQARRTPQVSSKQGALSVSKQRGRWHFSFKPTTFTYEAAQGEPVVFPERTQHRTQDWTRFPVSAISYDDAQAYLAWLRASRQLPGARLCSEHEWVRAARGEDARSYVTGQVLDVEDANFDATHGRRPGAFGPEQVGSRPRNESVFGVFDLQGNAQEIVSSVRPNSVAVALGGGWYGSALQAHLANRPSLEPSTRSIYVGLRVCADVNPNRGSNR